MILNSYKYFQKTFKTVFERIKMQRFNVNQNEIDGHTHEDTINPQEAHKKHCCHGHHHHHTNNENEQNCEPEIMGSLPEEMTEEMKLAAEVTQLRAQIQNAHHEKISVLAEMDNYRKRLHKEKQEHSKEAAQKVIAELLTPIDQFEGALLAAENMNPEIKNWAFGFQMILNQIKEVFSSYNVKGYDALNQVYDPYLHEAVDVLHTSDFPDGQIIKQYFKGYKMGEKVIRPAKVQVAKKPQE